MAKKINLNKSVYELTKENEELIDILYELGFEDITKKSMLNTVGKFTTIPKAAKVKNIDMMDIIMKLMSSGFDIEGQMPKINKDNNGEYNRREQIKSYLKRLNSGESIESVREDFVSNFSDVEASEIMSAEQEILKEGTPLEEVQMLCDVHSALFHGSTREEKIMNAEKEVTNSFNRVNDKVETNSLVSELSSIKGHPLYTFSKENEEFIKVLNEYKLNKDKILFNKIRELSIHYAKKGDLLYPHLKVRYGISGPSDVMWSVDDEIRKELLTLSKKNEHNEEWNNRLDAVLLRAEEMIYKEQNILFPICAINFSKEDWYGIYKDSKDYDICFGVINEIWEEAENNSNGKLESIEGEIVMPGGHMSVKQLTAMLNTIPLEISFIDENDINRYFNEGPKVFKRAAMAIDREVFSCHPPKVEPMVRTIINNFKNGKRDSVPLWMEKNGRTMLVTYMAVRDKENNYVGTMEIVQDMEFAKEHFKSI